MSLKLDKALESKISLLEKHLSSNTMADYNLLLDSQKITHEEAKFLYESKDLPSHLKIPTYFLLSDEVKKEKIDDINSFNILFNNCLKFVDDMVIRNRIFVQMSIIGYINASNVNNILSKLESQDTKGAILTNVIMKNLDNPLPYEITAHFFNIGDKYLSIIAENLIEDVATHHKTNVIDDALLYMQNQQVKKQLICKYITSPGFMEYDPKNPTYMNFNTFAKLKRLLTRLDDNNRYEISDYILNNLDNVNKFLTKESALAILPVNDIVKHLDKDKSINFEALFDYAFFGYSTSKMTKENRNLLIERLLKDEKTTELEKWQLIDSIFSNEERFEVIDLIMQNTTSENSLLYLLEFFLEVDKTYDINKFPAIKRELVKGFKIKNERNFDKLCERVGTQIINYLSMESIVELINLDNEKYDKIMNLFAEKNSSLNNDTLNTIVNSFLQREFRIEQSEDYNIFSRFEDLLQEKNSYTIQEVAKSLNEINKYINILNFDVDNKIDIDALFEHNRESIEALHKLTSAYIAKKRELFTTKKKNMALDSLKLEKYYSKSYVKKNFITQNDDWFIKHVIDDFPRSKLDKEELSFIDDFDRYNNVVEFKKNPEKVLRTPQLMSDIKILDKILDKMYEDKAFKFEKEPEDAKYEYVFNEIDPRDLLEMLAGLSVKHVDEMFENNNSLYTKLNNFMSKYKLVSWGNTFESLTNACDLVMDKSVFYSLINNFDRIDAMLQAFPDKNISLTALIDCASAFSSSSKKYSTLIGKENFEYISLNPGPNQSSVIKDLRVPMIPMHVKNMYERNSITVPSGEKTLNLNNGKNIKFSIGDIYNPIALTYGERTGACLRIKGAFDDLFTYALANKNGFHIRFEDPQTGEFVSRVTGIRNGNTVFLNELRESVDDNYDSKDLVESLQYIAKLLVESTKNEPHPIENVIVSNDLAMSEEPSQDLNIADRKVAFNGLKFNINNKGNILYTANKNHLELVPYKFGDEYIDEYTPYNNHVAAAQKGEALDVVNRIYMTNQLLHGEEFSATETVDLKDIESCIYGNGWVVYKDSKNHIHELLIDKFKNDKKLRKLIDANITKYFGGELHETSRKSN